MSRIDEGHCMCVVCTSNGKTIRWNSVFDWCIGRIKIAIYIVYRKNYVVDCSDS